MDNLLQPGKSYSVFSSTRVKSDFLTNLLIDYLKYINEQAGISSVPSIMGKHMVFSDTATPSKRKVVISTVDRKSDSFTALDISTDYINIIAELLEIKNKPAISFCKRNLARKPIEAVYYYMASMDSLAIDGEDFDETKAMFVVEEYQYAGVHTFTDKVQSLIDYIYTPVPANLHKLISMFPSSEVVNSLRNILANLIQEEQSVRYIIERNQDIVSDIYFSRRALIVSAALMKCSSKEELILDLTITLEA